MSTIPSQVEQIDWSRWQPVEKGTLLFVVCDDRILLIHKKRGLGAGKINGPGGRIDDGETPLECALREVEEEIDIKALHCSESGQLLFQFLDGYSIHVWVYRADDFTGTPSETEEAIPFWSALDEIPYDAMWPDDEIWLPCLLRRQEFLGRFIFDGDTMVDHQMLAPNGLALKNGES